MPASGISMGAAMNVAVVGAGPIGCATAAYLLKQGHRPALWSPTAARLRRHGAAVRYACTGSLDGWIELEWLGAPGELARFDVVIVCLPGNAYASVLKPLSAVWRNGQTMVVSGALSLCPLWLRDSAARRGREVHAVGWATTPTTAHFLADGRLHANPLRDRIDMAGTERGAGALALCAALLGPRFVDAGDLLAPTLANINPIAHAAEVIPNLTRMDKGEDWPLFGCFTPVVARLAAELDRERLALAAALGFALPTLAEHYSRSYHIRQGPLHDMAAEIQARGMGPAGPASLAHRYVLEDAPFGLVFQEALARAADVPSPLLSACIDLLQAAYGRDFRTENFLVDELGLATGGIAALRNRCAASHNADTLPR
ncbi:NAD/NADP octopine/nopaline dehydrogenase family protein [Pigmentiphaga sp. NML080357]|uniref:NAD/NADP octopine/nopaline dehydrogenase family protein n=1 Tax=Pigmentiphaga sp. NML080357 TaxID=2008675 RepID=UPI001303806D|nr:NAD/NADP octopine/nopaline dehydrogenase family protein [Pigmentiphaga sp. NML080357]